MLIINGRIAGDEILEDGALYISGPRIADIGDTAALRARYPDQEVLDARGQLVLPAHICAHTHFYGAFARGMAVPGEPAANFVQVLERLWWRLDQALDLEGVRYSALVCLIDAIRHGTTTLVDHHASPNAIDGSLDVIAAAVEEAGLRAALCYEVTDRDGPERAQAGIAENVRLAAAVAGQERIAASMGMHASLTLSDRTLATCAAAAAGAGIGFHLHVAEDAADQQDALQRHGKRVVQRLYEAGILGPRTIAAHCVHVDQREIELLAETGTWVTHQPRSNMNNGVGVAPVEAMLDAGIGVGLGNDGFSNNMFAEMKAAYLVHKLAQHDPRAMPGDRVQHLAYAENARLVQMFWPDLALGKLRAGAAADLVFLAYDPPTPLTIGNLPWHLLFGVEASAITTTICAGRALMRDRQLLTLDEEAIMARARVRAAGVWKRMSQ